MATAVHFSRKFVIHLDTWYAQSHPDEDFAETFAVWLKPKSNWRKKYKNWPAIKKLEYMDELMHEIGNQSPVLKNKNRVDCQSKLDHTIKEHYEKRRDYFGLSDIKFYDFQLYKVFSKEKSDLSAEKFLRNNRSEIRRVVAKSIGTYQYVINQILDEIILRCQELSLYLANSQESTKLEFTSTFSILTLEYIREGNHKVAR